jgi:hypothetical protein
MAPDTNAGNGWTTSAIPSTAAGSTRRALIAPIAARAARGAGQALVGRSRAAGVQRRPDKPRFEHREGAALFPGPGRVDASRAIAWKRLQSFRGRRGDRHRFRGPVIWQARALQPR